MGNFIKGILERNEEGAKYEGIIYDRLLRVRHPTGRSFSVFDPGPPLSGGLSVEELYEFILVAEVPGKLESFLINPPPSGTESWQGEVVDAHWRAPKGAYSRERPHLYDREWVLLGTSLGHLLMNPSEIGTAVSLGGVVRWHDARMDLYAVV